MQIRNERFHTLTDGESHVKRDHNLPIVNEEDKEDDSDIDIYNRDTKSETTDEVDNLKFKQ